MLKTDTNRKDDTGIWVAGGALRGTPSLTPNTKGNFQVQWEGFAHLEACLRIWNPADKSAPTTSGITGEALDSGVPTSPPHIPSSSINYLNLFSEKHPGYFEFVSVCPRYVVFEVTHRSGCMTKESKRKERRWLNAQPFHTEFHLLSPFGIPLLIFALWINLHQA